MANQDSLNRLIDRYGELIGGPDLARELGLRTPDALRSAIRRGRLPIKTFRIGGRRGWYARTHDLATFLAEEVDLTSTSEGNQEVSARKRQTAKAD